MPNRSGAVDPAHRRELAAETDRLLDFARGARVAGGFGWLDAAGRPDPARPRPLYVTCRMTYVFALGHLLGRPGGGPLADHGLAALRTVFRDGRHGGWVKEVGADGTVDGTKAPYEHAFVVVAAAGAAVAGRPGAAELLAEALDVLDRRFWEDDAGLLGGAWDERFERAEPYRGANENMHGVEALLAAYDATGEAEWLRRALRVTERMLPGFAADRGWRVAEHFDEAWRPLPEYNADRPADPFRPYGATVGHGLEWSRLAVQVRAALGAAAPEWLLPAARSLFDTAVADGWAVDGADGFVYTVDWSGRPVVRQRMHWVAAEALGAAAALGAATGDPAYGRRYRTWWDHVGAVFVDRAGGSWWHELGPDNRPAATVWAGKPDVYHALQATLLPRLPVAPGPARALADGLLDR